MFEAETPAERMRRRRESIEFYQHGVNWTNRMIAGDSLVVMNSLLEKEGMAGQVQMVYIDPPYGIKYGSNFQPFVDKRDVKDSHCVFDSAWEATESYVIEKNPHVTAWAKNDHLGFEILYIFDGVVRKYLPDFLIRLDNGKTLILETKGQETRRDKEKRKALSEWVAAVNSLGEYGEWCNDVSYNIADVEGIIAKYI